VKPYAEQWLFTAGDVDPSGGSRFVAPTSLSPDTDATDGTPITDDWPFLYLGEGPGTPANLLGFLALVAVASVGAVLLVMPRAEVPATRAGLAMAAVFFLFGAAFMLVETVSIMQVALLFGNTWHVVSTVILAVLLMAFCGNAIVERRLLPDVRAGWFAGLLLALLGCWLLRPDDVVRGLGVSLGPVVYVGLAASPVLFSSVLFSLAVRGEGELDRALGFNLLGAMAGGCLEYASLITGYRALTLGTMALYALAALAWWSASRSRAG
jgi:hypothetical protein